MLLAESVCRTEISRLTTFTVTEIQDTLCEWYNILTLEVKSAPGTLCFKHTSDNGQWPTK